MNGQPLGLTDIPDLPPSPQRHWGDQPVQNHAAVCTECNGLGYQYTDYHDQFRWYRYAVCKCPPCRGTGRIEQ